MQRSIRFTRDWHQFKSGAIVSTLDYGVMDALVNHKHTAEWVADEVTEAEKPKTRRSQKETV